MRQESLSNEKTDTVLHDWRLTTHLERGGSTILLVTSGE